MNGLVIYLNESRIPDLTCDVEATLTLAEDFADGLRRSAELNEAYTRLVDVEGFFRRGAPEVAMFRYLLGKVQLLIAVTDSVFTLPLPFVSNSIQCSAIRDIFGNPFRPVVFSPYWRTDTAVSLARQMYESRDFSAMPILADALQDAGCDNDDVLSHCRAPGEHVRGCWVVDLVLGRE
ncbi:hypothetical protein [Gemmata palustris]|uniref:hypothetical protein n=1 Tax=Gemmata palustris TaxID=2822762 RepID=UPI001FE789DC|nr:hypothetical protein [Gemmata palustris]